MLFNYLHYFTYFSYLYQRSISKHISKYISKHKSKYISKYMSKYINKYISKYINKYISIWNQIYKQMYKQIYEQIYEQMYKQTYLDMHSVHCIGPHPNFNPNYFWNPLPKELSCKMCYYTHSTYSCYNATCDTSFEDIVYIILGHSFMFLILFF